MFCGQNQHKESYEVENMAEFKYLATSQNYVDKDIRTN
jgi:hypothetical protein